MFRLSRAWQWANRRVEEKREERKGVKSEIKAKGKGLN